MRSTESRESYVVDLRSRGCKLSKDGLKSIGILADESSDASQLRMIENGAQLLMTELLSTSCQF